jgi:phosphate uptake regulator
LLFAAENKLAELEESGYHQSLPKMSRSAVDMQDRQISFFHNSDDHLAQRLITLDLMETTPAMAIGILQELQDAAKER